MKKILIADDEPRMLMLIKDFLESDYDITIANNGQEAIELFNRYDFDLLILDIMMPIMSGLELIEVIRRTSDIPIILLTAKTGESDELTGFLTGADEYIKKPFSPSILKARVHAILRRQNTNTSYVKGRLKIDEAAGKINLDDNLLDLSSTEYKLLIHLISNTDIVLSRESLLNSVWGHDYIGTDRTVDTTINRLRIKLGEVSHYIETVRGLGYRFEVSNEQY